MEGKQRMLPGVVRDLRAAREAKKAKRQALRRQRIEDRREHQRVQAKGAELRAMQRRGKKRAQRDEQWRRNMGYKFRQYGDPETTFRKPETASERNKRKRLQGRINANPNHEADVRARQAAKLQELVK